MRVRQGLAWLGLLIAVASAPAAVAQDISRDYAQYYPPSGYYPPPGTHPRPGYRLGGRCNARLRTAYGPRHVICAIGRPRPIGQRCGCPPPPPPPGYPPGPFLNGRVVR
jgi:hypothetical protein